MSRGRVYQRELAMLMLMLIAGSLILLLACKFGRGLSAQLDAMDAEFDPSR